MRTPDSRVITGTFRSSTEPIRAKELPRAVKTTVNPATNRSAARNVARLASRSVSSLTGRADT